MISIEPLLIQKKRQRVTYEKLAAETGIAKTRIFNILNGQQKHITLEQLSALCKTLGVDEEILIVEEDSNND